MENWYAIALGGAFGAVSRFYLSGRIYSWFGRDFPWGTLTVNLLGSFLMGFLAILLVQKLDISEAWRNGILVGFLGALTTFSTFSMDKLILLQQGQALKAGLYMLASVLVCLVAVFLGSALARQL